ncbi:MAG TPA: FAD-dependent oxidoreductase [Puia sp.]|nr:FAD-dependent oxidoreductase [Puia sp.]
MAKTHFKNSILSVRNPASRPLCLGLLLISLSGTSFAQRDTTVDICVYGGTSAGVIAACSAKRLGHSTLLIEPSGQVGGMTTGGLGETDIGNKAAITGIAGEFYKKVGAHYGQPESWTFEPHIAADVFREYIAAAHLAVWYRCRLNRAEKKGATITAIVVERTGAGTANRPTTGSTPRAAPQQLTIRARVFIDCSYEGDLMAAAGVTYVTGRESNNEFGETFDGYQLRDKHQFPDSVDPYLKPGDPSSGLLWGISSAATSTPGAGDNRIQAYNFRLCLTDSAANRLPITLPEHYKPEHYALLLRLIAKKPGAPLEAYLNINPMPNRKTDINNNGPFSTDMIGMNYDYPNASYAQREKIWQAHADYTKGLLYFLGHDPRVPQPLRNEMLQWGYPKDEFVATGHWSPQLYIREARRMRGEYVMTQANCQGIATVTDGIGLAAYTMDSHNCERLVVNGMAKNEGDVQIGGFGPYPVSYRSITPKASECTNLLVPVCLSATHIAYGSIRMEPVFMVLAESAALAAHLAITADRNVQGVDVGRLQAIQRADPLLLNPPASNSGQ